MIPYPSVSRILTTFDLTASSNLAGATEAVYTFHFVNMDRPTSVAGFSPVTPAAYSVDPAYHKKSGIEHSIF